MAKKKEEAARQAKERAEGLRTKKHAEEDAATQAKRKAAKAKADAIQQDLKQKRQEAAASAKKHEEALKKEQ